MRRNRLSVAGYQLSVEGRADSGFTENRQPITDNLRFCAAPGLQPSATLLIIKMNSRLILIQEIYVAALPLPADQRAAYLEQRCPDSGVREDVERMLASDVTETYSRPQDIAEPALRLRPGSLLGHYRIRKKLGAGGMGWVFEAFDEKLQRLVAIKVLPPGRIDDNLRKRLAREAQAASGLNHPNIVTVYEVGREQDMDFIAMERVAGRTLRELIGKKGLDARSAIQQAVQIADS